MYIISDISQLVYVPENNLGMKIVLETVRNIRNYNNDIFKIVHIKLYNNYLCSMVYEVESEVFTDYPYVYNIEEIIDVLNRNGFDIQYQSKVKLNETEKSILESLLNLGYNYIEYSDYHNQTIYISQIPINAYSNLYELKKLSDITTEYTIDDFAWLKEAPYKCLSISLLLNSEVEEPIA